MCRQCDNWGRCAGCWKCSCKLACFKCREGSYTVCSTFPWALECTDVREKFACFACKLVWKSKYTKYTIQEQFNTAKPIVTVGRQEPKCSKCSQATVKVGRNFRPCKNARAWEVLGVKVDRGEIDLIRDFHYYPREGIELISPPEEK